MHTNLARFLLLVSAVLAAEEPTKVVEEQTTKTATVILPSATILGNVVKNVESFGGIPFADPPTGQLRLRPPQRQTRHLGVFDATGPAAACPQMVLSTESESFLFDLLGDVANLSFIQKATGQTEDCLTTTVARPLGTKADAKLPVLFWIFGGGFELGWSSMYDGTSLINHGIDIKEPFIFVAVNYRVAGFGFMPGKEILEEGSSNLGLLDQRMGLEWVSDNIAAFGGDPDKVTIWGESAGAISVFDQMALYGGNNTYKGKPLFRGAVMNSGSIIPADPVDCPKGQAVFDKVIETAGCASAAHALNCLRELNYVDFLNAVNSVPGILSYNSVALSYLPRPDGRVLKESPDLLLKNGEYAAVPMIIGDQEDEGTLFALFQPNLTSTESLVSYLKAFFFNSASKSQLTELVNTYDDGLAAVVGGSPHRTGLLNEIFPGFKRRAALLGDLVFTLTRRVFLTVARTVNPDVPAWSYLASYNYGTPILGTFHGSDLIQAFYGILPNYASRSIRTYYINFVCSLDPNIGAEDKYPLWPRWSQGNKLITFLADRTGQTNDNFRSDSYEFIARNVESLRV
ncbi:lipase [Fusarium solani]|uniref:Carboxylic ester hydrolase n=1 Tax=Fusarium solani TaxID=169388 RepID=A0A9P9K584_FUSSL|nr:lipase [Fusarium solani]KAH7248443.1 lipase [Fusarium solani]